jgi:hypothetical protein
MATKTPKFTLEVLDNELTIPRGEFEAHIDGKLGRVAHEAIEDARAWALGLYDDHIRDVNERTSAGEDIAHEGLRQP